VKRRLHLIAPAGSCRRFLSQLDVSSAEELFALIQRTVGERYSVTGDALLIDADEDDDRGGRNDDVRRAADIHDALGDDNTAAIVSLRGGAWMTRILPRIDFDVLSSRSRPVAVFGFSELTTLVNIVGAHRNGRGVYDMGPAFLTYGLKRIAEQEKNSGGSQSECEITIQNRDRREAEEAIPLPHGRGSVQETAFPARSQGEITIAPKDILPHFQAFFHDVLSMIEGRGSARSITAELVQGELNDESTAVFVGGNLCVLTTLLGSRYRSCLDASDQFAASSPPTLPSSRRGERGLGNPSRWIVLEDYNEKPERIDRFLSHLTLAGCWDRCAGILLGDFHLKDKYLTPTVLHLLLYHLPGDRGIPILVTKQVGHVWPMSPLPLHVPCEWHRRADGTFTLRWEAEALRTVS